MRHRWRFMHLLLALALIGGGGWAMSAGAEAAPPAAAEDQADPPSETEEEPAPSPEPGTDDDASDESDEAAESSAAEERREVELPEVPWTTEIAAVLEKDYPQDVADLKVIQTQLHHVVERGLPATVAVQVGGAFGSAVIVSPDGLVLTAGHVVGRPGQEVRFIFADGSTARGETLGTFREIDSGMMQITDPGPWPYTEMAEADEVHPGEWVVAIGQPGGFDRERTPPVRLGRVLFANGDVITTDCTLVGGDSGGPLFNMRGQVIGIHSRIGRRITDNFHVPISTYHATWDRLVSGEQWGGPLLSSGQAEARPLLGVAGDPRADGCKLTQVFPGMPAERAGLQVGDVIQRFDDHPVTSMDDLVELLYRREPGEVVKVQAIRDEETVEVELRLGGLRSPLPGSPELPDESQPRDEESP